MLALLVPASDSPTFGAAAGFAAALAVRLGASLTGLCAMQIALPMLVTDAPLFLQDLTEELIAERDHAIAAEARFAGWARGHGVAQADWQVAESALDDALDRACDWHDFIVLAAAPESADPWQRVISVGSLLVHLRRPCIVVPPGFGREPDCVALAWNGSRQASRAIHAALPLLQRANRIVLLKSADADSACGDAWHPRFEVERHLRRHGVETSVQPLPAVRGAEAGVAVLRAADEAGADLLVAGAYGQSRVSEWALGGTTQHLLQHARIPLLMRH